MWGGLKVLLVLPVRCPTVPPTHVLFLFAPRDIRQCHFFVDLRARVVSYVFLNFVVARGARAVLVCMRLVRVVRADPSRASRGRGGPLARRGRAFRRTAIHTAHTRFITL